MLKNCAPFTKCTTEINEIRIDEAGHINIEMPMYNFDWIRWQFFWYFWKSMAERKKRDEIEDVDLTVDDNHIPNSSSSFK